MARKKKTGSLTALVAIFLFCGLLVWFYWSDLRGLIWRVEEKPPAEKTRKPPQEKILQEERKQLEDILKKRN